MAPDPGKEYTVSCWHAELDEQGVKTNGDLPYDIHELILAQLESACDLAQAGSCCNRWRTMAVRRAQEVVRSYTAMGCPRPLIALWAIQRLQARIGCRPKDLDVRSEWPRLRLDQALLSARIRGESAVEELQQQFAKMGGEANVLRYFSIGQALWIDREAALSYKTSIDWKVARGWSQEQALLVSVLGNRCSGVLTEMIFTGGAAYAASTWALCMPLWEQSWLMPTTFVAPKCYAVLHGEFGLSANDPEWNKLLSGEAGTVVRTSGFPCAIEGSPRSFPDGRGIHVPIVLHGNTNCELIDSDVVCFESAPIEGNGPRRTLIPSDHGRWSLPPFVHVTLKEVKPAGCWTAYDHGWLVLQRCFVVTVAY